MPPVSVTWMLKSDAQLRYLHRYYRFIKRRRNDGKQKNHRLYFYIQLLLTEEYNYVSPNPSQCTQGNYVTYIVCYIAEFCHGLTRGFNEEKRNKKIFYVPRFFMYISSRFAIESHFDRMLAIKILR